MTTNPRKLRIWDSTAINDTYVTMLQIQEKINEILKTNENVSLEDLPASMIQTRELYMISLCYEVMFDMLVKEQLIKSGNPRPNTTVH